MSKESHELSAAETAEFKDTLKALETTMRRHLLKETSSGTQLIVRPTLNVKPPVRSLSMLRRENTKISGPAMPSRKDKVIVQIRIVILKVGDIDTLRDKFAGDAFIQAKWREPAMDGKLKLQHEDIDWEVYWNPKLSIENAFGEPKENVWHSISFDAAGQATVCEKRRVTGSFFEFMELNQFPFDSQDLTITVTTDRSEEEIEFVEDTREKSTLNSQTFSDEQEWKLHKKVTTWTKVREEQFKAENSKHPSFCAATSVSRRPQFFIWNILVVMFLICSLSFATFSVSYNLPQSRLQLTFILLLTTVSFKFVVNQNLPMISYLTYLDKYILGSMAILATICIWHALVPFILAQTACNFQLIDLIDYIMLGSLSFIYVGFHLVFIGVVACQGSDNDEEEEDKQDFDGEQEDEFEDHENLGDNYDQNEKIDHRTARKNNAAEHATNQQTVMSGL